MSDWNKALEASYHEALDERDRVTEQLDRTLNWLEDALSRNQIVHEIDRERARRYVDEGRDLIYRKAY